MPARSGAGIGALGVDHGRGDVGIGDPQLPHVEHEVRCCSVQPFPAFAEWLTVGWFVGDECARSAAGHHGAVAFELTVRAGDGARRES